MARALSGEAAPRLQRRQSAPDADAPHAPGRRLQRLVDVPDPGSSIREIGLPLPAFIKWDDAEFCLRAREAGFPTVSMPGVALWHVSWVGKDDSIDWQAYFHARNRIVAGLLHSTAPRRRHAPPPQPPRGPQAPHDDAVLPRRAAPPGAPRHPLAAPSTCAKNLATAMPAARALQSRVPRDGRPQGYRRPDAVPARSRRCSSASAERARQPDRPAAALVHRTRRSWRTGSTRRGRRTFASPRWSSARATRTGGVCRSTTAHSSAPRTARARTSTRATGAVPAHDAATASGCIDDCSAQWPKLSAQYRAPHPSMTSLERLEAHIRGGVMIAASHPTPRGRRGLRSRHRDHRHRHLQPVGPPHAPAARASPDGPEAGARRRSSTTRPSDDTTEVVESFRDATRHRARLPPPGHQHRRLRRLQRGHAGRLRARLRVDLADGRRRRGAARRPRADGRVGAAVQEHPGPPLRLRRQRVLLAVPARPSRSASRSPSLPPASTSPATGR